MAAITAVLYREGKIRFTNLIWMFFDLFYPLIYFLLFGVMMNYTFGSPLATLGVDYTSFFLAGVLGMAGFGIATNTAWGFFSDRDNGIFYEMLTYPMSRAQFLVGKVLFNVLLAVLQAVITVGLGALWLRVPVRLELLPLLLAGVVVGMVGWFFFFAIFALRMRRNDAFNTVVNLFYFVFLFASSVFYPLELLPAWFRTAARLNPLTWHVDLLRFSSIGLGDPLHILVEAAAFVVFSLAAFAYGVRCLQRQE
ncbi:MAG: ABC transporter permease [Acidobacteria bacterium]|nr:ABC transporter permease [Acidobacteriota bacterium]